MNAPADSFPGLCPRPRSLNSRALALRRKRRMEFILWDSNHTFKKLLDRCVGGMVAANDEHTAMKLRFLLFQCQQAVEKEIVAAIESARHSRND